MNETTPPKAAQHSTAHNTTLHNKTGKMKTTIVGIALAAAAVTSVNALKCEKRETGPLVSWEAHLAEGDGHKQNYAMKYGSLVRSKERGEEYDFYECEAPEGFAKSDDEKMYGVIKTKDGKKCLTNSYIREWDEKTKEYRREPKKGEKEVRVEECAEEGEELRKQWFRLMEPKKKGCSRVLLQQARENDLALTLTYGEEGVAFSSSFYDDLGPRLQAEGYRTSSSFMETGKMGEECLFGSP